MPRSRLSLVLLALASGCLRVEVDGGDEPFYQAIPLSDRESIVTAATDVAASHDGERYGVIWQEYRQGIRVVQFLEVSGSGDVVEPMRALPIDRELARVDLFATERGYQAFYVSTAEHHYSLEIPLDGAPTLGEVEVGWFPETAMIARTGSTFALVFHDTAVLYLQRLTPTGAVDGERVAALPPVAMPISEHPWLAFTETGYHLVWDDGWGDKLGYAHLDPDGVAVTSRTFDFGYHAMARIAADGMGRLLLTWFDGDRLSAYALTEGGEPLWTSPRRETVGNRNQTFEYELGGADGSIAIVWRSDGEAVLPQIVLSTHHLDGDQAAPLELSVPEYSFSCPRIARGSGQLAVVFRGEVEGSQRLYLELIGDE